MKNIIILLLLVIGFYQLKAVEIKTIAIDSVSSLYQQEGNIFKILNSYDIKFKYNDIERLYNDNKLKSVLLKIFDKDQYLEYRNNIFEQEVNHDTDELIIKWFSTRDSDIDSIFSDNILKNKYRDSAYVLEKKSRIKTYLKDWENHSYLRLQQISPFIRYFRWQEFYDKLFALWEKDGMRIDSDFFEYLLYYHDPNVIEKVENYTDRCVKEGKLMTETFGIDSIYKLNQCFSKSISGEYGSWTINIQIKVLKSNLWTMNAWGFMPANLGVVLCSHNYMDCGSGEVKIFDSIREDFLSEFSEDRDNSKLLTKCCYIINKNNDVLKSNLNCVKQKKESEESYWKSNLIYSHLK